MLKSDGHKTNEELIREIQALRDALQDAQRSVATAGANGAARDGHLPTRDASPPTLAHSGERMPKCLENMMDCFGVFTAVRDASAQIVDFRIDYLNRAACLNNGRTFEEQVGQRLCEVLPNHRSTGLFDAYSNVVQTGEPVE